MDPERIYRKTPPGEEALRNRSQLKGGRLRSVLIMVDGQASVDQLSVRLGSTGRPDEQLAELERLGFIEPVPQEVEPQPAGPAGPESLPPLSEPGVIRRRTPRVGRRDRTPSQWPGPATESPPEAPVQPLAPSVPAEEAPAAPPQAEQEAPAQEAPPESPAPAEQPGAQPGAQPEPQTEPQPEPQTGETPALAAQTVTETAAQPEAVEVLPFPQAGSEPEIEPPPEPPAPRAIPWVTRLRAVLARRPGTRGGEVPAKPVKRRHEARRGPRLARLAAALALLPVAAAFVLPGYFRPDIEARLSQRLGQPVRIDRAAVAWQALPGLLLAGVTVGESQSARAAEVVVSPSVASLRDVLRPRFGVRIAGLVLDAKGLGALCAVAGMDPTRTQALRIDSVTITSLAVALPRAALEGLRGEIRLDPARNTPRVLLADADGQLEVEMMQAAHGCRFAASGSGWHPPYAGALVLDGLKATGKVDASGLQVEQFDARTSDGLIAGSGSLVWDPRPAMELRFALQHLNLAKLLAALEMPVAAQGEVEARIHLAASAGELGQLAAALGGTGSATVSRGAIERFDLVEAARNPGNTRVHGGKLSFEQLNTQLLVDRGNTTLRGVRLSAGALSADGSVSVKRDASLSGDLNVQLQGAAGTIRVPLHLGGTLAAPELGPAVPSAPRKQ